MGYHRNSGKGKSIIQYDALEGREYAGRLLALLLKNPFFGNTELSLELWTVIAGISGLDG